MLSRVTYFVPKMRKVVVLLAVVATLLSTCSAQADVYRDFYLFSGGQWTIGGQQEINLDAGTNASSPIGYYNDVINFLGVGGNTREAYTFSGGSWNFVVSQPIVFDPGTDDELPLGVANGAGNLNFLSASVVPEPSSFVLAGMSGLTFIVFGGRRKKRST